LDINLITSKSSSHGVFVDNESSIGGNVELGVIVK
jgi:hypothetical protein